jgi:peptidoglycan/xylan/chitin deacetylase (PgdA/CDA1 family)
MDADRSSFRSRVLRLACRLMEWSGLLTLARPLFNGTRLKIDRTGRLAFPYLRRHRPRNAQILIYHRVNDERDPYFGATPTVVFERQMAYVASRFRILSLSDLVAHLSAKTLPDNAIAVTLDDGYRDNYLNAFPVLQRYSIPATIFLSTAAIDSKQPLWHDHVFSAFRETSERALQSFGPEQICGPLTTVTDRLETQRRVLASLRSMKDAERAVAVARLREALKVGAPRESPGLMLSWDEVQAMSRAGIQFGSHTVTHPILSQVDLAEAEREVTASKARIEQQLGVCVSGFAYPNGSRADFLPVTKTLLREAGYAFAVTTISGSNETDQDLYELRRVTPWDEDVFTFGVRLHYDKLRS